MIYRFPKSIRLRKRYQYKRLARHCERSVGQWIVIEHCQNQCRDTRLGLTVMRQFGKAHDRNRFKRIVREAFRLCRHQLIAGYDLNIKPRTHAAKATPQNITSDLVRFLGRT